MKKPDSLVNQLKTIQSERNLARGSKDEIDGGALKLETAGVDSCEIVAWRSIFEVAAMAVT